MSEFEWNIILGVGCVINSAAVIAVLVNGFDIFKMKAKLQEELANRYTPDILKKKEEKSNVSATSGNVDH